MRFVHLTDMHITADNQPLYGLWPGDRLQAAVDCINQDFTDIAFVMMTGDLVNRGTVPEYQSLREIVNSLNAPHYLLLGNHDGRSAFRKIFPEVPVDKNGFVQFTFTVEDNYFIVLDTLDEGKVTGLLCRQRLDWLQTQLKTCNGRDTYLFLHHPPLRLEGGLELAEMIFGKVKHLFFGHLHRPLHGSWRGIPITSQFSTLHQFVYKFGSKVMQGCHEPPTLGAVNLADGNVVVNPHAFLDDSPRFNLRSKVAIKASSPEELPPLDS